MSAESMVIIQAIAFASIISGLTAAAGTLVPDHMIQILGRWSSDSYKLYIRSLELHIAAISLRLSLV